ncbi:MAG: aminotransferase class V-fold PLP-dependent enzyme [Clostridia bacterium]|nr:aminotransferase class V-fold PLP-dependent enzyme [Clostridia bacterium]
MIYLDNAATTLKKPPAVCAAMRWAMNQAAGVGRSAHGPAMTGAEILYDTRVLAAELFGLSDPRRVIFTCNATHALNQALYAIAENRHHFAISPFEHNAVYRPVLQLVKQNNMQLTILNGALWNDELLLDSAEKAIKNGADCFVLCHVSNVFGYIQPLEKLDALLAEHGIPLVLDASQSAGIIQIDVSKLHSLAAVCMPGHKGLYGPPGTGMLLWLAEEMPRPLLSGGTGTRSELLEMPEVLPDRLESGTPNVAGIAGLFEGMKFIQKAEQTEILQHERKLCRFAAEELRNIPGIVPFISPDEKKQTGVLSFYSRQLPAETIALRLAEQNICVRAGLHCAPLAHQTAGTAETGTVRIAPGWFQTERQMKRFCSKMARISGKETDQILE